MKRRWLRFAIQNHIENPFGNPMAGMEMYFLFAAGALLISPFVRLSGLPIVFDDHAIVNQSYFIVIFLNISFCVTLIYFQLTMLMLKLTKKKLKYIPYDQFNCDDNRTLLMFLMHRHIEEYGRLKLNTLGWLKGDSLTKPLLIDKYEKKRNKNKHENRVQPSHQFEQSKIIFGQFSVITFFNIIKAALMKDATYCDEENSLTIAVMSFWNDTINGVGQHIIVNDICPRPAPINQDQENDGGDNQVKKCTCGIKNKCFPNGPEFGHSGVGISTPPTSGKQIKPKNRAGNFNIKDMPTSTGYNFISFIAKQNASKVMTCLMCEQKYVCYNHESNRQNYQKVDRIIKNTHFSVPFIIFIALTSTFWFPIYLAGNRMNKVRILSPVEYSLYKKYGDTSSYAFQKTILWQLVGILHFMALCPLALFVIQKYVS